MRTSQDYAKSIDLKPFINETGWVCVTPSTMRLLMGAAFQSGVMAEQAREMLQHRTRIDNERREDVGINLAGGK